MSGLDRRRLLERLGAGVVATALPGQQPPSAVGAEDEDHRFRLQDNLFTRVGAVIHLNDRGPFTFVIDTGAGATAISEALADQLALPRGEPVTVHGITTATRTESVSVERLQLSGLNFENLRCPILPASNIGADGLLGLDVLGRFRLSFDVERRSASLSVRGLRVVTSASDMTTGSRLMRGQLRTTRGRFGQLLLTQVLVEGQATVAFIDSGAQFSIGNHRLQRAAAARTGEGGRLSRSVPLYGVTGNSLAADLSQVSDLRLGGLRLGPTPLLFADLHCFEILGLSERPALLIGSDLLGRFRHVDIDFEAGAIEFRGLRRRPSGRQLQIR